MRARILRLAVESFRLQFFPRLLFTFGVTVILFLLIWPINLYVRGEKTLLSFVCNLIGSIAVAAWVAVPVFFKYLKPRWQEWRHTTWVSSQYGVRDLERLVKLLSQVQEYLNSRESNIVRGSIQRELGRVQWNVWTEALPYVALHSKDNSQQRLALRNLSQT
jgi:hypothetical protein